jgi:hypothetical protein
VVTDRQILRDLGTVLIDMHNCPAPDRQKAADWLAALQFVYNRLDQEGSEQPEPVRCVECGARMTFSPVLDAFVCSYLCDAQRLLRDHRSPRRTAHDE